MNLDPPAPPSSAGPNHRGGTYLVLFLVCSLLLILPSIALWWRSTGGPLRVTPYEYDYFLGFFGSDYNGRTLPVLMVGKACHALILGLTGYGFWKYVQAQSASSSAMSPNFMILISVLSGLIYLGALAWMSPDVYFYFGTGWLESHYGGNPYAHVIAQIRGYQGDPMFDNIHVAWLYIITPYGPLFVKLATFVAWLSGGSQLASLLIFKFLCGLAHACNCVLAYRIAQRLGANPGPSLLLWALNPVMLFAFLAANHNDVFLLLCLLGTLDLVLQGREIQAVLVLALGVGLKYMPVFILPFLLLYLTRKDPLPRAVGRALLLGLGFLVVSLLPSFFYENGLDNFLRLLKGRDQLLRNFLYLETYHVLGLFGPISERAFNLVKWTYKGAFVACYGAIWVRGFLKREAFDFEALLQSCLLAFLAYFLIGSPELHEWYLPWFFPFAFFSRDRRLFRFGMVLSSCILPLIGFEVRSPFPILMAARYGCFAVIWCAAYFCLYRPRKVMAVSPIFVMT